MHIPAIAHKVNVSAFCQWHPKYIKIQQSSIFYSCCVTQDKFFQVSKYYSSSHFFLSKQLLSSQEDKRKNKYRISANSFRPWIVFSREFFTFLYCYQRSQYKQVLGRLFAPSQKSKKLSHQFRVCFELGIGILNVPPKIF